VDDFSELAAFIADLRDKGHGYKSVYRELKKIGADVSRERVEKYCASLPRNVMTAIGDAEDAGAAVSPDYFAQRGIDIPPEGVVWVAATVEENGPDGQKHWIRIRPSQEATAEERVEIRQAQPVQVMNPRPNITVHVPGKWKTWICNPDMQIGYWVDSSGNWHSTHDEAAISLLHQVAWQLGEDEGLDGWIDCGDLMDLSAFSRWNPTTIDTSVEGLNKSFQRVSEEFARRRNFVDQGDVVVLQGNHDLRPLSKANQQMPYLVGLRRPGDPEDEHPILTVPYMTRARDYNVEWCSGFPQVYRKLNGNLCVTHSPLYGGQALSTARKLAARMRMSVIFGHTHRSEQLVNTIETDKGARSLEIFSDGCLARTDGSLPSGKNSFDEYGNRMLVGSLPENTGMLTEAMDQGFSVLHVEQGGRERFSAERVRIWNGWCQFRGQEFESEVDSDGNPVSTQVAA
jgi:hypothetical protein